MNVAKFKKILSTGYWSDFYIYPIAAIIFFVYGLKLLDYNLEKVAILFLIGIILGSFIEYFIHRVLFHHCPVFKELHQLHHDKPIELIGSPTYVSLPVYTVSVFVPLCLITNIAYASVIFSAFLLDLLLYFIVHHTTHHVRSKKGSILHWYKRYHATHHQNPSINFSVAFPIWDIIFRTKQKK
ncbi:MULTISPECIES: sterol desaturase family protein [unclassified Francisella]|uniref:sterol desaturase family protein n=1 Tax=unclassified Francisella TaxID=2610885 RepID=UPI002E2F014A|nr:MULTISPECIES: sterol desaturase family protein [unclassified Francisella]MED7818427.1 sterol desaturase family protein [Francisella sp. 19S2-4]MED7829318.1 sterol desaturase family protein [Francisella sp. 19S2-10]